MKKKFKLSLLDKIVTTRLERFENSLGDVCRGLRISDATYSGFGEVYFSWIKPGKIKAWKKHHEMTANIIVPVGSVKIVCSETFTGPFKEFILDAESKYSRITIPPDLWFGLKGLGEKASLLVNVANMVHDPSEVQGLDINQFDYEW